MSTTAAPARRYAIDPSHTSVEFVVRHMMLAKVRGRFTGVSGTIEVAEGADLPSSVDVTIDAATIDTREEQRDTHLKSADFLDTATYGEIRFRSTGVEGSGSRARVSGDLTIHGTTRPVILETTFEGRGADPWGNQRIGYEAKTSISRKEYGLHWNQALEAGGVLVGDEVTIELSVEAVAQ